MSWRRFSTLLRGLGPNSAAASRATVRRLKLDRKDEVHTVTGTKEQVSAVFSGMFGGLSRRRGERPSGRAGKGKPRG